MVPRQRCQGSKNHWEISSVREDPARAEETGTVQRSETEGNTGRVMPIQVEGRSRGAGAGAADMAHLVEDDPEDHGES